MEVVTPTGKLVTATPKNSYSDLFYAINGGNGQFGTVTKFFVRSWPTPSRNQLASVYVADADLPRIYSNIVSWYKNNKDPYSLVYFAVIYSPGGIAADPTAYSIRHVATMFRMQDDSNPAQADFNTTFAPLIAGLDNSTPSAPADVPFGSVSSPFGPAITRTWADYVYLSPTAHRRTGPCLPVRLQTWDLREYCDPTARQKAVKTLTVKSARPSSQGPANPRADCQVHQGCYRHSHRLRQRCSRSRRATGDCLLGAPVHEAACAGRPPKDRRSYCL